MVIAFISNFINHHQVLVADCLYQLTGGNYHFIETCEMPVRFKKSGYDDFSNRPYIVKAYKDEIIKAKAKKICQEADVLISVAGNSCLEYEIIRAKTGKLLIEYSERWLKKGLRNLLSPRFLKWMWAYHKILKNSPCYKLCSGAYVANDMYLVNAFKNKCFKWGYFTKVNDLDIDEVVARKSNDKISVLWVGRFISWKHPEYMLHLAEAMQELCLNVEINMVGGGELKDLIQGQINKRKLSNIYLLGNMRNEEVLHLLRDHHIFCLTSDRNEGWGAVLNEAMSNGCAVVASDQIGSVPFLIQDERNGSIYQNNNITQFIEKVIKLVEDKYVREKISKNAYYTMMNLWSPSVAANNLLTLIDCLINDNELSIKEGPCSPAYPYSYRK